MRAGRPSVFRAVWPVVSLVAAAGAAVASGLLLTSSPAAVHRVQPPHVAASTTTAPAPSVPTAPTTAPRIAAADAVGFGTPSWISIPSVGISESVVPLAPSGGVIEPPPHQVVWDSQTPEPGALGASIVLGHDEWAGPSAFWNLDEVRPGARITMRATDGASLVFVVTGSKSENKTAAQYDRSLWSPDVSYPELIVVTCDRYSPIVDHHALNNYIVYARELGSSAHSGA